MLTFFFFFFGQLVNHFNEGSEDLEFSTLPFLVMSVVIYIFIFEDTDFFCQFGSAQTEDLVFPVREQ